MNDTPWLDRHQMAAWVRFVAVLELLPGVLDSQLRRDSGMTHFEYFVMAVLSETPGGTLRMAELAAATNSTLSRLSHVVQRLEGRGFVERVPCPENGRVTNARLTADGRAKMRAAAPGHVASVRRHVVDVLTPEQTEQLAAISEAILQSIDPSGPMAAGYRRYDVPPGG
ncbi:DNA-binding transcriptional regulator, MarR family [Promicromonospora umidemergens]|uniref:MarR family winged helix-turn-helix transcriptional regulator n=1 Tax=Promicromonospora umidemergens TaxID=629679 RepID=A0ABP8WVR4_9MICO|nr:MarR family transcriptional regulator [Promicromonospora umidemergens]MCP2283643.1 DNA-binding transcriptional regulator, MarR family [Promicromonospora umidemergens]